jgi:hypothetical protein
LWLIQLADKCYIGYMYMKYLIIMIIIACSGFWNLEASAFWGNPSTDPASGLNVEAGFDVNTITTITGKVVSPPEQRGQGQHTEMTVTTPQGNVTVVLGPWSFWEKQAISVVKNQELTITGSLAQGKDGTFYLFVQRIENQNTGETTTLRSESGAPLWSRGGASSNRNGLRGMGNQGGMRWGRK